MNRIKPTHFVEITSDYGFIEDSGVLEIDLFYFKLHRTFRDNLKTTAIFLIAPSDKTIEERMEERRIMKVKSESFTQWSKNA